MLKMVGLKLTEIELKLLDEIVVWCDFHSRSDALRIALIDFAEKRELIGETLTQARAERKYHPIRRRVKEATESYIRTHKTEKKVRQKNG